MHTPRRLVVVRHAKAEAFAPSDIERVLAPRGHRDAADLGTWLAGQGIEPDVAWVSVAARTRETWADLAAAAGWTLEPHYDGQLYGTDEEGVLELVHATPDDAATVVVVGHNPTMAMLVQLLDDGAGTTSGPLAIGDFPTSAAVVFEVDTAWGDVAAMSARLVGHHVGRG